jgi:RecA-family ATPase
MAESVTEVPFYLLAAQLALVADHQSLIAAIRATLGQTVPAVAGSESDDRDMSAYVQAADAIRDIFKCAVIVVHHCGHEGTRPRGHSSLMGAADAQLTVRRDPADNIVVTVEYMKDGPASEEIVCRLEAVEVGEDTDGDLITSCVVVSR